MCGRGQPGPGHWLSRHAPPPRLVGPRRGSLEHWRAASWTGLSPSGPPAHSCALPREGSTRAATAWCGLPALRPFGGSHFMAQRRAPARPPGPYLLREREERCRHLPADSGSERRRTGAGRRVRTGARSGARATEPGRGRGRGKAAHAQQPSLVQDQKRRGWGSVQARDTQSGCLC